MNLNTHFHGVQGDSLAGVWEHNSSCIFLLILAVIVTLNIS